MERRTLSDTMIHAVTRFVASGVALWLKQSLHVIGTSYLSVVLPW
jgi:hypothetical protein